MLPIILIPLLFSSACIENLKMFGDILKVENSYYQITGFTSVVYDNRSDDVYIKDGRVRVRSCGRYLEYRARPLVHHCSNCGD